MSKVIKSQMVFLSSANRTGGEESDAIYTFPSGMLTSRNHQRKRIALHYFHIAMGAGIADKEIYIKMYGLSSISSQNIERITSDTKFSSILACIPITAASGTIYWRANFADEYSVMVKDRDITQLRFQLVNEQGAPLANLDNVLALKVDTLQDDDDSNLV